MSAKSLQSRLTLCNPEDCNLLCPGDSRWSCHVSPCELPCPPPGDLPDPQIKPLSLTPPALAGRFFSTTAIWEALVRDAVPQISLVEERGKECLLTFLCWFETSAEMSDGFGRGSKGKREIKNTFRVVDTPRWWVMVPFFKKRRLEES